MNSENYYILKIGKLFVGEYYNYSNGNATTIMKEKLVDAKRFTEAEKEKSVKELIDFEFSVNVVRVTVTMETL